MDIKKIAHEMSKKYKDNELTWVLMLKRLENENYDVIEKPILKATYCKRCGKEIIPDEYGRFLNFENDYYCYHCALSELIKQSKPEGYFKYEE